VRKDYRAVLGDVFIEQDVSVSAAQQSRQRGLAIEKRCRLLSGVIGWIGSSRPVIAAAPRSAFWPVA